MKFLAMGFAFPLLGVLALLGAYDFFSGIGRPGHYPFGRVERILDYGIASTFVLIGLVLIFSGIWNLLKFMGCLPIGSL